MKMKSRAGGVRMGFGAVAGWIAFVVMTGTAVHSQPIATAPAVREAPVDFAGTGWMEFDPVNRLLLVAAPGVSGGTPRLMVLGLDGKLRKSFTLTGLHQLESADIRYFPASKTAAIFQYPSDAEPDSALGQDENVALAKVRLLDLESGRMQAMPGLATAVGVDVQRKRLFLAKGQNLRVIDAATGRLILTRHFARNIDSMQVTANGRVHFLQSGFGGVHGSSRILSLAAPAYTIASRKAVRAEEDGMALLAVDEKHGYALMAQEIGDGLDSELAFAVAAEPLGSDESARVFSGPDEFAGELIGWREGAPYLYLHDPATGELRVYDAATLDRTETRQGVYGEFLGFAPSGEVVMSSGQRLERRDPRTFQVLNSVEMDGPIQKAVIDGESQQVHVLIESQSEGRWSDRLLQVDLQELQPVL